MKRRLKQGPPELRSTHMFQPDCKHDAGIRQLVGPPGSAHSLWPVMNSGRRRGLEPWFTSVSGTRSGHVRTLQRAGPWQHQLLALLLGHAFERE